MKVIPFSDAAIAEAVAVLKAGGIVAHATETCYGFACDLTNENAVAKLFAIKKRPLNQPVSALFASVNDAQRYVTWNTEALELAKKHLPGPLTLIIPLRIDAPRRLHLCAKKTAALGMRVSSHPIAQELVTRYKSPLSTTSANLHGADNLYSPEEILEQFALKEFQPDLILDSGPLPGNPPSTVIDLSGKNGGVARQGGIQVKK